MNPKITITVDARNRARVTMTGLVTVGARVDVEVRGLVAANIPDWGEDDDYTGKSLRFRLVDERGHDLARFPFVKKSETSDGDKWTVTTVEGADVFTTQTGLEGSPVLELDTDLMRHAFCCIAFDETRELGIVLDSAVDHAEYAYGTADIRQWSESPKGIPRYLPCWNDELRRLARRPTTGTMGDDSSLDDVIAKVNTLIVQLKG